eukprot:Ihof_evm1s940 gene=Ihof_evmTU1s940
MTDPVSRSLQRNRPYDTSQITSFATSKKSRITETLESICPNLDVVEEGKRKGDQDFEKAEERSVQFLKTYVPIINEIFEEDITLVGEGGFGAVFRAIPKDPTRFKGHKVVAVKLFYSHKSEPKDRLKEVECLCVLNQRRCPNVPHLLDFFTVDDHYVMVMEFVEHDSFKSYRTRLDVDGLRQYMKGLLIALQGLWAIGYVHRDVKPENVLYDCKRKTCCLVDFGLAHIDHKRKRNHDSTNLKPTNEQRPDVINSSLGKKATVIPQIKKRFLQLHDVVRVQAGGTRGFRPPEVLLHSRNPQTTAIDMWAAGTILLSIASGRYPFFSCNTDEEHLDQLVTLLGPIYIRQVASQSLGVLIGQPVNTQSQLSDKIRLSNPPIKPPESNETAIVEDNETTKYSIEPDKYYGYSLKELCETFQLLN